jgi:uncharacterized protein YbjT (DUF2867 family)
MALSSTNILVVGATGKQGGAVVQAILNLRSTRLQILALTRNAKSETAQSLVKSSPGYIELIQGDVTEPGPIFESQPEASIRSMFVVTSPGKIDEEKQAIPLIDAAVEHGVKHIVFSSVERGGDEKSWDNPTTIKHFYQKHNIEHYLRDKAAASDGTFTWTILRPTAFLDNMNPGIFCSVFTSMWASALKPETKLQLISVHDIGTLAAQALTSPEEWSGKAVGLAGTELTLTEAKDRFKSVTNKDLPECWTFVGSTMLWAIKEVGAMFAFFENEGYHVDIEALRKKESSLQDFETWLKESSKWRNGT